MPRRLLHHSRQVGRRDVQAGGIVGDPQVLVVVLLDHPFEPDAERTVLTLRVRIVQLLQCPRDIAEKQGRQRPEQMSPAEPLRCMLVDDALHNVPVMRLIAADSRLFQDGAQPLGRLQRLIEEFDGNGDDPALRSGFEPEAVNATGRHVDQRSRSQFGLAALDLGAAAAALDQEDLVQMGVSVRPEFPVVDLRPRLDRLAMHDVRQFVVFAEQMVILDGRSQASRHARSVQVFGSPVQRDQRAPRTVAAGKAAAGCLAQSENGVKGNTQALNACQGIHRWRRRS